MKTLEECRKLARQWISEKGDDETTLLKIRNVLAFHCRAEYRGGKLFIGGEEV